MKNLPGRLVLWGCIGIGLSGVAGFGADPSPIPRGESGSSTKGATKALELMREDPRARFERRISRIAKNIRFKMLVRKDGDTQMSEDYAWTTRPKAKGNAPQVVYPYEELLNKETGRAIVRFRINHEGKVDLSTVLEATKPAFGRAAQAALETMAFTPGKKKDGSPALVLCDAEFEFKPDGTGDVLVREEAKELVKKMQKTGTAVVAPTELDGRLSPISTTSPVYPTTFSKVGAVGSATIEFVVDEEGSVMLPRVVSATEPEFGAAAVHAVSVWQFNPPEKGGRSVNTRAQIEIEFNPNAQPKT